MTQLMLELSQLEVEPIELQEPGIASHKHEQNTSLETLTSTEGKNNLLAILTLGASLPLNSFCSFCYVCTSVPSCNTHCSTCSSCKSCSGS